MTDTGRDSGHHAIRSELIPTARLRVCILHHFVHQNHAALDRHSLCHPQEPLSLEPSPGIIFANLPLRNTGHWSATAFHAAVALLSWQYSSGQCQTKTPSGYDTTLYGLYQVTMVPNVFQVSYNANRVTQMAHVHNEKLYLPAPPPRPHQNVGPWILCPQVIATIHQYSHAIQHLCSL